MFESSSLLSNPLVAIGCLVCGFVVILFLEYRTKNKNHRAIRILFNGLALLALAGLWFTPSFKQEKARPKGILLSEAYDTSIKDSLAKKYPNAFIKEFIQTNTTLDIPPETDSLFLLGNGFPNQTLKALQIYTLIDFLNPAPTGLENIMLTSTINVGEQIEIIGKVNNRSEKEQQLYLSFFDKTIDSISITADSLQWFVFNQTATQTALWEGEIWLETDTYKNSFGIEVLPNSDLSILVLEAAPSFELKELKKLLSQDGQKLVSRMAVSKGKNQFAFFNTPAVEFNSINKELLNQFNWLIMTADALKALSKIEKTTLEKELRNGKNILILTNEKRIDLDFNPLKNFSLLPLNTSNSQIPLEDFSISLKNNQAYINKTFSLKTIIKDDYDRSLVAYKQYDIGKIGVSTLTTTYPLLLKGSKAAYQTLWKTIAQPFTQTYKSSNQIVIDDYPLIFPKEKTNIRLRSAEQLPSLNIYQKDSLLGKLYLQQQQAQSNYWEGDWWFNENAWHKITTENGSIFKNIYVAPNTNWQSIQVSEKLKRNRNFLNKQRKKSIEQTPYLITKKISLWWFYGLFLLAMTGLWLLEKR